MTLSLPSIADLLSPPYMAVLRRTEPVLVPPGSQWTTVVWDRADSDAWDGFDPAEPDGWRAPAGKYYQAAATGFSMGSADSFAFEATLLRDGGVVEFSPFLHLLRGSAGDEFDEAGRKDRPVIRHSVSYAAFVDLEPGQRVGLALRHSLPVPLLVESEGGGLGWVVQQIRP